MEAAHEIIHSRLNLRLQFHFAKNFENHDGWFLKQILVFDSATSWTLEPSKHRTSALLVLSRLKFRFFFVCRPRRKLASALPLQSVEVTRSKSVLDNCARMRLQREREQSSTFDTFHETETLAHSVFYSISLSANLITNSFVALSRVDFKMVK